MQSVSLYTVCRRFLSGTGQQVSHVHRWTALATTVGRARPTAAGEYGSLGISRKFDEVPYRYFVENSDGRRPWVLGLQGRSEGFETTAQQLEVL